MLERIEGFVVGVVKHSDRYNIVTLFTRSHGRLSLLSGVGSGRNARMRNARLQLLSVIESDINFRSGRDLSTLGTFQLARIWHDIYYSPSKCSLLFFLAEFLNRFLKVAAPEELTYDYIVGELARLDGLRQGVGNFHLSFLVGLMEVSGIYPDSRGWRDERWFDLRAGEFVESRPLHPDLLYPAEAKVAAKLLRLGRTGIMRVRMNRQRRGEILKQILKYYSLHFPGTGNLTTPDILGSLA